MHFSNVTPSYCHFNIFFADLVLHSIRPNVCDQYCYWSFFSSKEVHLFEGNLASVISSYSFYRKDLFMQLGVCSLFVMYL